jgi:hypothetical protein
MIYLLLREFCSFFPLIDPPFLSLFFHFFFS